MLAMQSQQPPPPLHESAYVPPPPPPPSGHSYGGAPPVPPPPATAAPSAGGISKGVLDAAIARAKATAEALTRGHRTAHYRPPPPAASAAAYAPPTITAADIERKLNAKPKYEYDSDEDTTDGTWEHKKRAAEMKKTAEDAQRLNAAADSRRGTHFQNYIPKDVLEQFLEKVSSWTFKAGGGQSLRSICTRAAQPPPPSLPPSLLSPFSFLLSVAVAIRSHHPPDSKADAVTTGREADLSDYRKHTIKEGNVGYQVSHSNFAHRS